MLISDDAGSPGGTQPDLKEIVMGLQWDPPEDGIGAAPTDLDAVCVLFDTQGAVLDMVHPGHPRIADDSVIHTGDSRTGAGAWDDERIFVFLDALAPAVSTLAFVVVSATGRAISEARGASCHVSDCVSERELVRLELSSLPGCSGHIVTTLQRSAAGWKIGLDAQLVHADLLAELRALPGKNYSATPASKAGDGIVT